MEAYPEIDPLKSSAVQHLVEFMRQHHQAWAQSVPDLEIFERDLHMHVLALEREILADELARYDLDVAAVRVSGKVCPQAMTVSEDYLTMAGVVKIERHLYRPVGHNTRHVCPLEMRAGIVEGFFTPAAARQAAYVVAHLPPATGADLFGELGGMQPSPSSLERLPKSLSERWEAHREAWEAHLRTLESVPPEAVTLAVSLDGVLAPMRRPTPIEGETPAEAKQPKGPKGYQEVGCGAVSLYDAEGQRLQTIRYGRMPESHKVTLSQQLQAECQAILAVRPRLRVVKLSDGARHNWKLLSALDWGVPAAQVESWDIVDFYHACDHLKHATDAIWGEFAPQGRAEFERLKTLLKEADDGADVIIRALRYRVTQARGAKRDQLRKELAYFRNQRPRMNYPTYVRAHLPIASGVVEATCKTLVTQRLKQSGMRWTLPGGQAILTLRSLIQSRRWPHGWRLLCDSYQQAVEIVSTRQTSATVSERPLGDELCQQPVKRDAASPYFTLPLAM
jgi:hypothetical protein